MIINKDFREFVKLLNEHRVKYLIVGGYAVAFHGYPRYTKDIDIWIKGDKKNAIKVLKVLKDFGFGSLDIKVEDFLNPDIIIQLGNPPNRIDLITELTGVTFDTCYQDKFEVIIGGIYFYFISIKNLKKNKKALGRYQDLADIENLI